MAPRRAPTVAVLAAALAAILTVLAVPAAAVAAGEVAAGEEDPSGNEQVDDGRISDAESPDILREPDSGRPPQDAGDRGGVLQALVLVVMVGGVGGLVLLAVRESRRKRRVTPEGGTGSRSSTRPSP